MVYILAVAAALANALTSIFQRIGVEDAPAEDTLRLRLMAFALKRGIWLAGFGLMIASFLCQAVALHLGRLTVVQPILTTELLFLVLILGTWFRFPVGWREWVGALGAALGLAGFLWFASPSGGNLNPTPSEWAISGGSFTVAIGVSVVLARRGPRWWRAAMFGTGAAIAYALTAGFTKVVSGIAARDLPSVLWHWQSYGLAVFGLLAVFLTQNAYHAGPIAASQATIVLIDPLASILIGVSLFGDNLRTLGAWGPLEAVSLLVLFAGALLLCQSPLVSGAKGEGEERTDLLMARHRARQSAHTGVGGPDPAIRHAPGA